MKRVKQSDIWKAARWVLGPEDSWGSEYYIIIFDVAAALESIVKTGDLQEFDIKTLRKWEEALGCDWIIETTKEEGECLLENLCY